MQIFRGIVFQVQARDADALGLAVVLDFEPAAVARGNSYIRDLIALGKIGIEIIFAGETRRSCTRRLSASEAATPNSTARLFSTGSAPGKPRHTGQVLLVRRIAEAGRAGAKDFRGSLQLHVHFEPDDRLISRHRFRRDARRS